MDPGWQGALYCPVYNLAERQVVVPHKECFFTMDFTRTTPVQEKPSTYGYSTKPHEHARPKTLQGHDVHRLRSAPFESLRQLTGLNTRVNSFNNFTFLVLAVVIAAIGVIASFGRMGVPESSGTGESGEGLFVLTTVSLVFGFSGLLVGVTAMALKFDPVPRGRWRLAVLAATGAVLLSTGAVLVTLISTSSVPAWLGWSEVLPWAVSIVLLALGLSVFSCLWYRATRP